MRVVFHRLADAELVRVGRMYSRQDYGSMLRFVAAVNRAVDRIRANPSCGAPIFGTHRWVRVGRFRYLLYYEQTSPTTVRIYAVAHASRRPGYWRRRVNRP